MPNCYLFCSSQGLFQCQISPNDLVIAVDGGYSHAERLGITPHVLIGDLDSIERIPDGIEIVKLPAEKDVTDTLAALDYGLSRGFTVFHIYGGLGGRLDHTLANIACLQYLLKRGAHGYLHDDDCTVTAFSDKLELPERESGTVSVFAYGGDAYGVTEIGLKYPLDNAHVTTDFPIGVSNEFIGKPVTITVERGTLVAIYPLYKVRKVN